MLGTLPAAAGPTDLTFFLTGDTHYGLDLWANNEPANKATIDAMNRLPGTPYPAALGGVVGVPSGVLVAGDLTDTPEYVNFFGLHIPGLIDRDGFDDDYAVDGSGRLRYPVYEGYGNHDVDNTTHSYTLDGLRARNLVRPGITHLSSNGLNYSWDWQGVHFVNLNIYPGTNDRAGDSLGFLQEDLRDFVGGSDRPVVLMHHFGFDGFSLGWWSDAERQAYADAIDGYNVVGIFHGHMHSAAAYQWQGYDVFDGSPANAGNFLVVRLNGDQMDVAGRNSDNWVFTFRKTIRIPEPSTGVLALVAGGCAVIVARRRGCQSARRKRRLGRPLRPNGRSAAGAASASVASVVSPA